MRTIVINNPGPQGSTGPQGVAGPSGSTQPFNNVSGSIWATTSSLQISGSFLVSGSSTFTNIGPAIFSGSATITGATTMSSAVVSGDVTVLGTASINVLQINTTINSTGSNILGDAANDTQTLYGTVRIPTGSLVVSGNVSFGTSSAGFLWNNASNTLTVNNKLSVFSNASGTFLYSNEELFVGSSVNRRLAFFVNSLEAMRIADTTRNILIGTTTDAGFKLDVNGTARVQAILTILSNIRDNRDNTIIAQSLSSVLSNRILTIGNATYANINLPNGNVLIGTTTDAGYKLDVNGNSRIKGSGTTSATTALRVENTNASASLVVLDNGFVGINTGSAQYNLDVNGTARVSGIFTCSNQVRGTSLAINDATVLSESSQTLILGAASWYNLLRVVKPTVFNNTSIDASAQVQIDSTTAGFLPPRMTNAQRTAIATPAVGLMVYCTDATEGLYIYKSTGWTFIV